MDETPPTLGELLRSRRGSLGLSQRELARRAGLSLRALRNIEQSRVRRPHPKSLRRLAEVLRLPDVEPDGTHGAAGGSSDPATLRIAVLGPLEVSRGRAIDLPAARMRYLLGLLAIQPGQVVSAEEIVDALWGSQPPRAWQESLHHYVWRLRGLLEPERPRRAPARTLVRARGGYRLELDADQLDLLRFDRLAAQARRAASAGDPRQALRLWAEALRCWRGPVLAGLGAALRQHPAAVAIAGRRAAGTLSYADLAIDLGRYEEAAASLRANVADEPLQEGLHARLMVALAGLGQQAAALTVFAELRTRLADELGVAPGPEIQHAHLRVLRHEVPAGRNEVTAGGNGVPAGWVAPAQLPADVPGFIGRAEAVARLDALLDSHDRGRTTAVLITAIGGAAGVGKTALAVHWAHRVAGRFGDGQLYVNLRGFDATGSAMHSEEALRGFLTTLGVPAERIPTTLEAQVGLYRSLVANRRFLIVLDNANDAEQVRPLLPGTPGCLALVTSRKQLSGLVAVNGAHPLAVAPLARAEARELLRARLGRRRVDAEPDAVDEIVTRCAGLPLALAIVAARAATRTHFPLAALAAELRDNPGGLDGFDGGDPAADIRAVFSWSYRTVSAAAAKLFRQLGLHPGPDITAPAAASLAGTPVRRVHRLLAELVDASLISEPAPGRYAFHDLLRAYAAEQAHGHESEAGRRAALCRVLDHYLHTADSADLVINPHRERAPVDPPAPGVAPERLADSEHAVAWFTAEHAVLLLAVRHAVRAGLDRRAWQLAAVIALYLDRQGRWHDLRATQHAALAAARRDGDVAGQANAHHRLGGAYLELGCLEDAHAHYGQAIDLFGQIGGHVSRAYAHLGIAIVFDRQDRYSDALHHAELALDLYRAAGRRSGAAHALNSIGWYRAELGDHRQAVADCREAIAIQQEIGDPYGESHTWDSLGYAYDNFGDHAEAAACYRRSLDLLQHTGETYYVADTLTRLGDACRATGEPDAARDAWQRALDILTELDHPDAHEVRAKLARLDRMVAE
ncbi:MAG TPA: BTAD domain-containing putative transcriptional regulator [Pilimelia sp.]|nr:BTAD domain-containing putative transcriptional regulator [Pilimelia sp.]